MRYSKGNMVYNLTTRIKENIRYSILKSLYEEDMEKVQREIKRGKWIEAKRNGQ